MKKRIAAIVLCVFCLLAIAGCSQSKPDAETAQPTAAQETGDYLTTISGTYEELFPQLEDRHGNPILEVCDLPDETLVGYQWAMYQVVLINLKAIIDAARELWPMVGMMVKSEVNIGVCTTLLHELFHMAQNDPYAPEELFKGLPKDPEQAAEAWAINTWETDGEYVLN